MTEASTAPRSTTRAGLIGGLAAGLVFLVLIADGKFSLLRRDSLGHFYDVQAHAFLGGNIDVPFNSLGPEAIIIDNRAYMYYGPWPSLLRMPIAALTDRFDGRLTQLSMLLAFAVAMAFTYRLTARIRTLARGDAPFTRLEQWATGAFVFVVGAGSILTFLGSLGFVYHEAEIWGAALAIAAFDFIVAYLMGGGRRALVWASALSTLAFLSRGSVGAGPVAALALIFVAGLWEGTRRLAGLNHMTRANWEWRRLGIAWAIPAIAYAAVNYAKFGTLFTVPANRQILYAHPDRIAALADNGNSLFGLKFAPTVLAQMLRPDGLRVTSLFPWVSFPPRADVIGDVKFDTIDLSASLTATMPLLIVLAIIGLVGIVRTRAPLPDAPATLAALRMPVLGAAGCLVVTVTIAFVAHRYQSDFVPLLVLLGAAGMHVVLAWLARTDRSVGRKRAVVIVLVVLGVLSVWVNVGLAYFYQRTLAPTVVNEWRLADFVRLQHSIHDVFPGGDTPNVQRGDQLPDPGALQSLFVLGDCRALFWSGGDGWRAIERTNSTGYGKVQATFADAPAEQWQPLLVSGRPGAGSYIAARVLPENRVVFGFFTDGPNAEWFETRPIKVAPGPHEIGLVYDPSTGRVEALVDGRLVMDLPYFIRPAENVTLGRSDIGGPVNARFAGELSELPVEPTLCRELTG